MAETKPKHGGARKGAGRKPSGRKAYLIRMRPSSMEQLRMIAKPKPVGAYLENLPGIVTKACSVQ